MTPSTLVVPSRFCGPPRSGNGGWSAGALADLAPWSTVTVRLSAPPPLDVAMDVAMTVAEAGGALVASYAGPEGEPIEVLRATETDHEPAPVEPVSLDVATEAAARYPGLTEHPFPTCVVCGTGREPGDGLRVFAGPVVPGEAGRSAAVWTPTEPGTTALAWAAMDCPGAWAADIGERLMVLGTMTARVDRLPVEGEPHVVVGEARGRHGRRTSTATSLLTADGELLGTAEQVWIDVPASAFA
ncbi:hypothetical protein [Nocardioides flavescens]|uniref:Thioesterase-like superfamily protein n=1 Tax=Nocardioides flavescens TaxID=2691959 RepID=A0A6L7F0F4_9ACTN|nr:hypothetical protein [Nocardioides flavescens]MXG90289.1 hypothetical protein [Nocardioides flavescens]